MELSTVTVEMYSSKGHVSCADLNKHNFTILFLIWTNTTLLLFSLDYLIFGPIAIISSVNLAEYQGVGVSHKIFKCVSRQRLITVSSVTHSSLFRKCDLLLQDSLLQITRKRPTRGGPSSRGRHLWDNLTRAASGVLLSCHWNEGPRDKDTPWNGMWEVL